MNVCCARSLQGIWYLIKQFTLIHARETLWNPFLSVTFIKLINALKLAMIFLTRYLEYEA